MAKFAPVTVKWDGPTRVKFNWARETQELMDWMALYAPIDTGALRNAIRRGVKVGRTVLTEDTKLNIEIEGPAFESNRREPGFYARIQDKGGTTPTGGTITATNYIEEGFEAWAGRGMDGLEVDWE